MLIRLLIIIILAVAVFYLLRRYKGGAKRLLPLILSPAILPYIKQVGLFLLRILFRRWLVLLSIFFDLIRPYRPLAAIGFVSGN